MKSPVCDEELDPTQRGIAPYSSDLFSDLTEQAAQDENGEQIGGIDYPYTEQQLSYIPLHIHSDYSIMDGLESVEAIVKQAAKLKIPAIALTDWTNLCGYIKFYSSCKNNGIKPIMGADLNVQ